ncbi:hypothetical protein [Streptomyces canus]|uniref:hypothetical protein n=1 Tax=Streptomyces canus TaxID=58343 RepID=UPI002E326D52|nr:hypothetical protein [Streptomyces canus]
MSYPAGPGNRPFRGPSTGGLVTLLAAFLTHLDMEQLDDDGDDSDTDGSDDERARYDFRAERAVRHAEFIAEARNFARRMIEGDVGWPPPLTSDAS